MNDFEFMTKTQDGGYVHRSLTLIVRQNKRLLLRLVVATMLKKLARKFRR